MLNSSFRSVLTWHRGLVAMMLCGVLVAGCKKKPESSTRLESGLKPELETKLPPVPRLSENAPEDVVVDMSRDRDNKKYKAELEKWIKKGKSTYPDAKKRFLAGLPKDHHFFVVTILRDPRGNTEQVFVSVSGIKENEVVGRLASNIVTVSGYKANDAYVVAEEDILDWVITRPDGSEDGNVVGKFLEQWAKRKQKR